MKTSRNGGLLLRVVTGGLARPSSEDALTDTGPTDEETSADVMEAMGEQALQRQALAQEAVQTEEEKVAGLERQAA